MNALGYVTIALFIIACLGGVAAWLFAVFHWARRLIKSRADGEGPYSNKTALGCLWFAACWVAAMVFGGVGVWFGGWAN